VYFHALFECNNRIIYGVFGLEVRVNRKHSIYGAPIIEFDGTNENTSHLGGSIFQFVVGPTLHTITG